MNPTACVWTVEGRRGTRATLYRSHWGSNPRPSVSEVPLFAFFLTISHIFIRSDVSQTDLRVSCYSSYFLFCFSQCSSTTTPSTPLLSSAPAPHTITLCISYHIYFFYSPTSLSFEYQATLWPLSIFPSEAALNSSAVSVTVVHLWAWTTSPSHNMFEM